MYQKGYIHFGVQIPSSVTRRNETHPSSVCIAGYGAPYGYSTAAPAYGTYSPLINKLENIQKRKAKSASLVHKHHVFQITLQAKTVCSFSLKLLNKEY